MPANVKLLMQYQDQRRRARAPALHALAPAASAQDRTQHAADDLSSHRAADGTCGAASLVLTAVASVPVYVDAEAILRGHKITPELIETVGEAAVKVSHPVDNTDMDYWYRKRMTKVYVKRALAQISGVELKSPQIQKQP